MRAQEGVLLHSDDGTVEELRGIQVLPASAFGPGVELFLSRFY